MVSVECVDVILPMNEAILKLARLSLYPRLDASSGVASVGHVVKGALKLSVVSSHREMKPCGRKNYVNEPRRKLFVFLALHEVVFEVAMPEVCFATLDSSHAHIIPKTALLADDFNILFSCIRIERVKRLEG